MGALSERHRQQREQADTLGDAVSQALRTGRAPISHKDRKAVQDAAQSGAAVRRVNEEHAWYVDEVRRLGEAADEAKNAESVAATRADEMEAAILSNQPISAYNKSLLRERTRLQRDLERMKKDWLKEKAEKNRLKSTVTSLRKSPLCAMCGGPAASPAMVSGEGGGGVKGLSRGTTLAHKPRLHMRVHVCI